MALVRLSAPRPNGVPSEQQWLRLLMSVFANELFVVP
jgi:hypothetical protein